VHPVDLAVLAVLVAQVVLAWVVAAVVAVVEDLVVPADMEDRVVNMMEDSFQFYKIHPQKGDILFVVGEDHSNSFSSPTILL
jgi:hypothetical protein